MRNLMSNIKNQKGAALAMSILILSLMMISAVALSKIILGEVKMTVNTSNSLTAFYIADSAIEKGLYYVKYARKYGDGHPLSAMEGDKFSSGNGGLMDYIDIATTTADFVMYDISTSTPAHVDIIDPAGEIGTIDWDPYTNPLDSHYYELTWKIDDCFPQHSSDKLEITEYAFSNDSGFNASVDKDIIICNCDFSDNDTCDATLAHRNISDNSFYRFSFRPLDVDVRSIAFDVYVDPFDGADDYKIGVPSNVSIIADGEYKNVSYRLKVETPSLGAISDIFSYVIFSEQDIIKNL